MDSWNPIFFSRSFFEASFHSSESAEQSARGMDSECRGHVDDIRGD